MLTEAMKAPNNSAKVVQVRLFVSGYSEAPPSTVGSVLVQDLSSGGQYSAVDSATVHFRPIPDGTIEQLIQEGTVFSCAGAARTYTIAILHSAVLPESGMQP